MIRCSFRNAWCQSMSSLAELMLFMSCVGFLFRTIPKQSVLQWWGRRAFRGRKPSARWDWDILRGARQVKTTQFLIKDNADYWKLYSFERKSETTRYYLNLTWKLFFGYLYSRVTTYELYFSYSLIAHGSFSSLLFQTKKWFVWL